MSFYTDFILILPRFYLDFIRILSRFYPDFIQILSRFFETHFIQILSRFYPDQDKIEIKGHERATYFYPFSMFFDIEIECYDHR